MPIQRSYFILGPLQIVDPAVSLNSIPSRLKIPVWVSKTMALLVDTEQIIPRPHLSLRGTNSWNFNPLILIFISYSARASRYRRLLLKRAWYISFSAFFGSYREWTTILSNIVLNIKHFEYWAFSRAPSIEYRVLLRLLYSDTRKLLP